MRAVALTPLRQVLPGVALAFLLALVATFAAFAAADGIASLPKIPLSPVLCAVLLGMLWRNTMGVPSWSLKGLEWTTRVLLRLGIALVGLRLTLNGATAIAGTALPVAFICIGVALLTAVAVARWFGVPKRLAALLAIGTAVCGCTAIVATSPVIRARNIDTAFAVACVVLFGSVAMLCYPLIAASFFSDSPLHAGIFLGSAIHDTSQVIGAGLIYSQQLNSPEALAAASVTKLLRNLSMAVLIPAAAWWGRRQTASPPIGGREGKPGAPARRTEIIPFFVVAFILFMALRTAGDALFGSSTAWSAAVSVVRTASDTLLVSALAAVGLSVSFNEMWQIGWRPLVAALIVAMLVGASSLALTLSL